MAIGSARHSVSALIGDSGELALEIRGSDHSRKL